MLIESRDSFEYGDVGYFLELASDLAEAGNEVTLFLVQNGVMMARNGAQTSLQELVKTRVSVLADEFCLKERAISDGSVLAGVTIGDVDTLVDLLAADGVKAVWH